MFAGIAGSPVSHSLSPVLHQAAYDAMGVDMTYQRCECDKDGLPDLLGRLDDTWAGLSVTMPLKQVVTPHLDMIDGLAKTVGAVNTICVQPVGPRLIGFNTDVEGIVTAVRESAPGRTLSRTAILGARATASSALAASVQLGATHQRLIARRHGGPGSALSAATRMGLDPQLQKLSTDWPATLTQTDLLISTLPAHVADDAASRIDELSPDLSHLVYLDVVYDPWPTALAESIARHGGVCVPGWLMLLHQAVAQVRLFTGRHPDVDVMRIALENALEQR